MLSDIGSYTKCFYFLVVSIAPLYGQQNESITFRTDNSKTDQYEVFNSVVTDLSQTNQWDYILFVESRNDPGIFDELIRQLSSTSMVGKFRIEEENRKFTNFGLDSRAAFSVPSTINGESDLFLRPPKYRLQAVLVWNEDAIPFLRRMGAKGYFTSQHEWLILTPTDFNLNDVKRGFSDIASFIDSEVLVLHYHDMTNEWLLTEIWRVGAGAKDVLQADRGNFTNDKGGGSLNLLDVEQKYERRKDMHGFHLRAATIITMPYESLTEDMTRQNFHSGYVVDIWHTFQEQLNFTYTATNTLFGSLRADGTWNGMVGMLINDEADVAVAPLSITQIRSISIDFTLPIQIISTRLYIRRPVLEATWVLYSLPFDTQMWICVPCSILFTSLSLWLLNLLAVKSRIYATEITYVDAFYAMFTSLVQQATMVTPIPFGCKFMMVVGFLSNLVLYTCYAAILVSILATMKPQLPFSDFEELRNNPDWSVGVRTNTALADALALSAPGSPMKDAWETNVVSDPLENLAKNNDHALANVLKGKYAFFANKEYIIYLLQNRLPEEDATNIVDTGKDFLVRGIGFGLQKNSPYRNLFNNILAKMTSSGHLNRLKRKWWPDIKREPERAYPSPGFKEVFTVFLIFGIGLISSVTFFFLEKFRKSYSEDDDDIDSVKDLKPMTIATFKGFD